jgi:hypothetical protein
MLHSGVIWTSDEITDAGDVAITLTELYLNVCISIYDFTP